MVNPGVERDPEANAGEGEPVTVRIQQAGNKNVPASLQSDHDEHSIVGFSSKLAAEIADLEVVTLPRPISVSLGQRLT
jgi:hypothetical protein